MEWSRLPDGSGIIALGADTVYLVSPDRQNGDATGVRLTRYRSLRPTGAAQEAARNVIVFPLGRGPGRPVGEPELAALTESAKVYADRFEAGESLDGYPYWQHEYRTKAGRVLTDTDLQALADEADRGYDAARFWPAGGARDCPHC